MNKALLKSEKHYWETPPEVFDPLNDEFGFTLDPCAQDSTAKCDRYFTINENGLHQDWGGETVFCNPPYGNHLKKWIAKCYLESQKENTVCVMLIPSRTDTAYFHDIIKPYASEVRFLRGRIEFLLDGVPVGRAPFGSMIVVFKKLGKQRHFTNVIALLKERVEELGRSIGEESNVLIKNDLNLQALELEGAIGILQHNK